MSEIRGLQLYQVASQLYKVCSYGYALDHENIIYVYIPIATMHLI